MTLTLILIGGIIALTAVFVVATQLQETVNPILASEAGEAGLLGLSDPAADTLAGHYVATPPPMGDWQLRTLASLGEAQDLLDCLEHHGVAERELVILGKASFAVRWR
jgi:hypothetical protein